MHYLLWVLGACTLEGPGLSIPPTLDYLDPYEVQNSQRAANGSRCVAPTSPWASPSARTLGGPWLKIGMGYIGVDHPDN